MNPETRVRNQNLDTPKSEPNQKKEGIMPRREKDRELARKRKRKDERRKLRVKGLLPPAHSAERPKEVAKKKVKKEPLKEAPSKEAPPETPREKPSEPAKAEG